MFDGRWRHAVDRTTQPVGQALVRARINADVLTVFGLAMSVVTAFVVGSGHLIIGIPMLFATGLPDLFDGPVAKASGTASKRGSFFDSVADRVSDGFMYGGIAWYLASHHHGTIVLLPFAILAVTSLISYQRAKAELLGLSSGGGLMERAERFILLGVCFLAGYFDAAAFVVTLWVFFGLVTATAAGRFVRIWQEAEGPVRPVRSDRPMRATRTAGSPVGPEFESVGPPRVGRRLAHWRDPRSDSRWKAWREARSDEPLNRWWARRDADSPARRQARTWRERRQARLRESGGRLHSRVGRHSWPDGTDGSADGI